MLLLAILKHALLAFCQTNSNLLVIGIHWHAGQSTGSIPRMTTQLPIVTCAWSVKQLLVFSIELLFYQNGIKTECCQVIVRELGSSHSERVKFKSLWESQVQVIVRESQVQVIVRELSLILNHFYLWHSADMVNENF